MYWIFLGLILAEYFLFQNFKNSLSFGLSFACSLDASLFLFNVVIPWNSILYSSDSQAHIARPDHFLTSKSRQLTSIWNHFLKVSHLRQRVHYSFSFITLTLRQTPGSLFTNTKLSLIQLLKQRTRCYASNMRLVKLCHLCLFSIPEIHLLLSASVCLIKSFLLFSLGLKGISFLECLQTRLGLGMYLHSSVYMSFCNIDFK